MILLKNGMERGRECGMDEDKAERTDLADSRPLLQVVDTGSVNPGGQAF